ncbi:MAG: hypothetical protein IKU12_03040 [Oscillospiraceae bacterium]|nr:hypothetical protein [Oscillospiraceae bacterium]
MKRMMVIWSLVLALATLSGCIAHPVEGIIGGADGPTEIIVGEWQGDVTLTCRVVEEDDGFLTLAEFGGNGVYTLNTAGIHILWERAPGAGEKEIQEGSLVDVVHSGEILESWPMEFAAVTELRVRADGFDDMCEMYLDVLDDLWEADDGLNGGASMLSVELSGTSLSPSEQAAVRWVFGNECGISTVLDLSMEELKKEDYIKVEEDHFTHWEDGVYIQITEEEMEGVYSLCPVTFDAWKWRSSLGAYFFSDCNAVQNAMGSWSDYTVGAHMIS